MPISILAVVQFNRPDYDVAGEVVALSVYDPKTRHWPNDPTEWYQACANAKVVAKFNHPGDGTKSHGGLKYSEVGDKAVQLIEVRKPDGEKAYIRALN